MLFSPLLSLRRCLLLGAIVVVLLSLSNAKVVHNTIHGEAGLKFLAKFCFSIGKGNVTFQSWAKSGNLHDVILVGFDDEASSWPAVYDTGMSCQEQRARAKWFWPVGDSQFEHLTTTEHNIRYWYLALSRCSPGEYEVEYKLQFTQGGGYWENQFSYDEWALQGLYLALFIVYFVLVLVQVRVVMYKLQRGALNHLHRLFTLVVISYEIAFVSMFIHAAVYADDGVGSPGLDGFGQILSICGEILFVGLILAMARGWLVVTTELKGVRVMIGVFCIFLVSYIAFFIWENVGVDLETMNNVYESVPGIINLVVRSIIWVVFAVYIVLSLLNKDNAAEYFYQNGETEAKWEPEAHGTLFFVIFGSLMSIWFLILPFFVVVCLGMPEYDRLKVILYMYYITTAIVQSVLATWFCFKNQGPVEGGNSLLGGLVADKKVYVAGSLDMPVKESTSNNPLSSSSSRFRDEVRSTYGTGIELQSKEKEKKENATLGADGGSSIYDNL